MPLQKSFADQVVEHSDKLLHYARKLARDPPGNALTLTAAGMKQILETPR